MLNRFTASLRKRQIYTVLLLVGLISGFAPEVLGQQLLVRAVDQQTGAGIPDAILVLPAEGRKAVGDAAGYIQIEGMFPGTFEGIVSADGYSSKSLRLEVPESGPDMQQEVFLNPFIHELASFEVTTSLTEEDQNILARRESITAIEQISGEDLQDITDDGVADALSRIAGVNIDTEEGSVSGINIRGAGAKQTRITVDGQGLGGGRGRGGTRGARAMNQIPKEFLTRIRVMKAPTPDMDADAIGGTVDLQTTRISNAKESRTSLSQRSTYLEQGGTWGHRLSLAHAIPFTLGSKNRRAGILAGISFDDASSTQDQLRVLNQWPLRNSPETGDPFRLLARLRVDTREVERQGYGFIFNADLQLNNFHHFYLKTLFNDQEQILKNNSHTFDFIRGKIISLSEKEGEFEKIRLEKQFLERETMDRSATVVIGGEHRFDDWLIDESIGYSYSSNDALDYRNGIFRTDRDFSGSYSLQDDWRHPSVAITSDGILLTPENLQDPDPFSFYRYDLTDDWDEDTELALQTNATRRWEAASGKWIFKSGLKARLREADSDRERLPYSSAAGGFSLSEVAATGPATVFGDRYPIGPAWSAGSMEIFFDNNPQFFDLDPQEVLLESVRSDFAVSESIYSIYTMVQRETDHWVFIAGIRGERTDSETSGYQTIIGNGPGGSTDVEIRPVTVEGSYDMFFPGAHALFKINPQWIVRASVTRTLQRPDFRDLSPSLRVSLDTKRVRSGNPDLDPFDAKAIDIGTDIVLSKWGALSLGVFYKRIQDFIVDIEETRAYLGEPGYIWSRPVNGSPADLYGVETAWSTQLAFLPGFLEWTSLNVNYTWTDSTAAYPGHEGVLIMLPEQVRQTLNFGLRWQMDRWTLNLRTRYRGLKLRRLIEPGQDQFEAGYWSHSLSIGYKWNDTVSLSLGASNLNQPERVSYQGRPGLVVDNSEGGRVYSIGLNIRFGRGPNLQMDESRRKGSQQETETE